MSPLNEMLGFLDPVGLRCKVKFPSDSSVIIDGEGGMQVVARELPDGLIEVAYEHALHEVTRERCAPATAARLLRAVLSRSELVHVAVPSAS
jgi:hypothetical protein